MNMHFRENQPWWIYDYLYVTGRGFNKNVWKDNTKSRDTVELHILLLP